MVMSALRAIYIPRSLFSPSSRAILARARKAHGSRGKNMLLSHSPTLAATTHRPALPSGSRFRSCSSDARLRRPPCARSGVGVGVETLAATAEAALLRAGLRAESLPRHVAVVMDGNSRWARKRGLAVAEGHAEGRRTLERTVRLSRAWGVSALTAFAFSLENFSRPKARPPPPAEVDFLMELFEGLIRDNVDEYAREGIRLHVIGDASRRPASLQSAATEAEEATRHNSQLVLMLAICYSGRWDIARACRELAAEARYGLLLRPEDIDEAMLDARLVTSLAGEFSSPDLLIRTSGEMRLSNFLLWQSAYSELYFTDTMWPDFGEEEYLRALGSYQSRDRRFGQRKF
ncbi:hypothetical protein ACP70R_039210 [Stipagrostis hirtigluma subsp. patula]